MIKRLEAHEIGAWILNNLKEDKIIEFALDSSDNRGGSSEEYTNWWFMRWIFHPQYESIALLIDHCGGGCPYTIAYDTDKDFCERVELYFLNLNDDYNSIDKINVEITEV